jgi:phosphatidylethanolamine/phosphatidyl-N-methylethanolamine N-methyltransferase
MVDLSYTEYTEKVYNFYSAVYDFVFGPSLESGRKVAVDLLNPRPYERILEVGVGTGLSIPYFPRGSSIVGIDLSKKMLEVCERKIEKLGRADVELHAMDATHLSFPEASFDGAIALYCMSCLESPVEVLLEMKRVVKPGGRVVFMNHFQSRNRVLALLEKGISPLAKRVGFRTDLELPPLLGAAGMTAAEIRKADPLSLYKAVKVVV